MHITHRKATGHTDPQSLHVCYWAHKQQTQLLLSLNRWLNGQADGIMVAGIHGGLVLPRHYWYMKITPETFGAAKSSEWCLGLIRSHKAQVGVSHVLIGVHLLTL